jgi:hypothetical protein
LEGSNYIIERNSIFTTGDLVVSQFDKLQFILKHFLTIDINLIEALHYQSPKLKDDEKLESYNFAEPMCKFKTPLHLAV